MVLRAFLVDDQPDMRDTLVEAMEALIPLKFVGVEADERAATRWLAHNTGQWDISIVDLHLEKGSGFNVLKHCQHRSRRQIVVVLTSYRFSNVVARCIALGADRVFDKSEDIEKMLGYCLKHLECLQQEQAALVAVGTSLRAAHHGDGETSRSNGFSSGNSVERVG